MQCFRMSTHGQAVAHIVTTNRRFAAGYSRVCYSPRRFVLAMDSQDTQQLLGVSPSFAAQVDLVLCAGKPDNRVGFPVHSMIISGHSPVLCQLLEEMQSPCEQQRQEASLLTIPMMDDRCTAVRALLEYIYQPFQLERSEVGSQTDIAAPSMDTASAILDNVILAHKYGMTTVLLAQEQGLMIPLQSLLSQPVGTMSQDEHSFVLKCASVADQYSLAAMSTFCEGVIALHFTSFSQEEHAMASTLSSASMLRIAQISYKLQTGTTEAVCQSLRSYIKATKGQVASSSQFAIDFGDLAQATCPKCYGPLYVAATPGYLHQQVIKHTQPNCPCKWPEVHFVTEVATLKGVDKPLADLQTDLVTKQIERIIKAD